MAIGPTVCVCPFVSEAAQAAFTLLQLEVIQTLVANVHSDEETLLSSISVLTSAISEAAVLQAAVTKFIPSVRLSVCLWSECCLLMIVAVLEGQLQ